MSVETAARIAAVPLAGRLETFGDRPALITADGAVSYRDLARRSDEIGERLGPVRRLVLVAAANDAEAVAGYLAALRYGHPVLLVPRERDAIEAMTRAYAPDSILDGWEITERNPGTTHDLHPDLALLLSTSGTTGSPKLVRLSHENVQSNAEAIADFLGLRADDRAATTLPLHYCYGLSVLNSHLMRGAAMILTCRSVAETEFWDLFRRERGTSFAAVPYTFDLLDRVGFAEMNLPDLRYITQAGGRLDPERVRRYARLGQSRGWDLFVMYGQTEATARMAFLPPHLAESAPDAIGVPIPGGSFRIRGGRAGEEGRECITGGRAGADTGGWAGADGIGELVYRGPNVMLGYAQSPADLGLGRVTHELRTGDLARRGDDGLYRIVGRHSRFLKLFGLRVDLQRIESLLASHGVTAFCAGDDRTLVVAVQSPGARSGPARARALDRPDRTAVRRLVTEATGLPASAVAVHLSPRIPRLASGKPDYPAIAALTRPSSAPAPRHRPPGEGDRVAELTRRYAMILDREDVTPAHSFVDLGGDSLSYVEASINVEQVIGTLPPDWHVRPIADLAATSASRRRRRLRMVDTSVLLRALAIVLVVGTHVQLFGIPGGAHMLLGVAGYNFARFQLTRAARAERVRGVARSAGRIAAATVAWIALVMLATDQYTLANIFLVNNIVGTVEVRNTWHFWYIEDLLYVVLAATALLSLRTVDRAERRWPFAVPLVLMAVGLVARYQLVPGVELHKTMANGWLFAIGWAAATASSRGQRVLLTVAMVATIPGYFGNPIREAVMIGGLLLLICVPVVPMPRLVAVVAGGLAGASLYIYLVHWQVYVHIWQFSRPLALVASLAAGLVYAAVFRRVTGYVTKATRGGIRRSRREPAPATSPAGSSARRGDPADWTAHARLP